MEKRNFNVTTDSASDAGRDYLEKLDASFISFNFTDGETSYKDEMDKEQNHWFYEQMRAGTVFKTSQLNVDQYEEFFLNEGKKGLPIIHISLCEGLSNTVNNARIAAVNVKKQGVKVHVIDATIACLGIYLMTVEACKYRDEGMKFNEAIDALERKAKTLRTYYTTEDLTYFARGGRLSKSAAFFSKLLKINVILDCDEIGRLNVKFKFKGRKKAFEQIVQLVNNEVVNPETQTLAVVHAENLEGAKLLAEEVLKVIPFKNVEYHEMGPTIGAHAGPGLIAVFYFGTVK